MPRGLTKKLDFEKGQAQAKTSKPDYRERFQDEGDTFDRGGIKHGISFRFRGNTLLLDIRPFLAEDRQKLIRILEWHTLFTFAGRTGSVSKLSKDAKIGEEVAQRFTIMRNSVLRAQDIVAEASKEPAGRVYPVIEFRCSLKPAKPFPRLFFLKHLAFAPVMVGSALDP